MAQDLKSLVHEVLRDGFAVNLGVSDASGPWVAPVVYVFDDDFDLYWISIADCQHSRAIAEDPHVAAVVIATHDTDKERALQMSGRAMRVEGAMFELEQRLQAKRGMPAPQSPGDILTDGYEWYRFTPDRFEITYNTLFGYDRQTYKPNP
jgi:nitroimidazol reductase NimA-like FMN-containing flavoprotein (pyridoxamine 5'-phosphate oxidase superfamily)